MTDAELIVASRRDPRAFRELYDRWADKLLAYFYRRVLDPEVAADLLAETFAVAYERRKRFNALLAAGKGSTKEAASLFASKSSRQVALSKSATTRKQVSSRSSSTGGGVAGSPGTSLRVSGAVSPQLGSGSQWLHAGRDHKRP